MNLNPGLKDSWGLPQILESRHHETTSEQRKPCPFEFQPKMSSFSPGPMSVTALKYDTWKESTYNYLPSTLE